MGGWTLLIPKETFSGDWSNVKCFCSGLPVFLGSVHLVSKQSFCDSGTDYGALRHSSGKNKEALASTLLPNGHYDQYLLPNLSWFGRCEPCHR